MQQSAEGAAQVNLALDQTVAQMKQIDASSNKISGIIRVIDEIAFQTSILALNAAVEAARAGEAGLGFAVVADEVRNLAKRCATAAKETQSLIEESIRTAHEGRDHLNRTAAAMHSMTENASRVRSLVDEVSALNQDQAKGMDQIATTVRDMDHVTQTTAHGAQETAAAGAELKEHATALRGLVREMREMVGAE